METRELLQAIECQCLVMSADIHDMKKELETMNEKVLDIKKIVTEALNKPE